jgi:hypothetical protein
MSRQHPGAVRRRRERTNMQADHVNLYRNIESARTLHPLARANQGANRGTAAAD